MSINILKESMKKQAEKTELPKFYKEDVELDFKVLAKYGNCQYVWMLREAGSLLFPLKKGIDPFMLDFYIRNDSTCRFFVIESFKEEQFKEVNAKEVEKLIYQSPIEFGLIDTPIELINKMSNLLKDNNIATSGLVTTDLEPEPVNWNNWLHYFDDKNPVMKKVMNKAIALLNSFNNRNSRNLRTIS